MSHYSGNGIYVGIALICVLVMVITKPQRVKYGVPILILVCVLLNPLLIWYLGTYWLEGSRLSKTYLVIPIFLVIAYVIARYAKHWYSVALCVVVLVLAGNNIITRANFSWAENAYKVNTGVVEICDYIEADATGGENIRVLADLYIVPYIRQYDPRIILEFGRWGNGSSAYSTALLACVSEAEIDTKVLVENAKAAGDQYLILGDYHTYTEDIRPYGYTLLTNIGGFNIYKVSWETMENDASDWTMRCYDDYSGSQSEFFTFKNNETGELIVIDGGWTDNAEHVRQVIRNNGGTVDAWILTHYHTDHIGAFNTIYADPKGIEIKNIYVSPLDADYFLSVAQEWDNVGTFELYCQLTAGDERITEVQRDDVLSFGDLTIEFFNTYDETLLETGSGDVPNDCSLVFKVTGKKDSILFCGDCHSACVADMLIQRYGEQLQAEYVQPGHHGNNSFPTYFYDVVNPSVIIFNAPDWLLEGEGYTAKDLKNYMEEQGVSVYSFSSEKLSFLFE
jgi:beta-lactamase superfamily II metal-dependent hydrolase